MIIKPLIINKEKIAKDFGSIAAMARHYDVSYQVLRKLLYEPANTSRGATRRMIRKLLNEGYVSLPVYTPEELMREHNAFDNKWRRRR